MNEPLEELQADVGDLVAATEALLASLSNAESCENLDDFIANLKEATLEMDFLSNHTGSLLRTAQKGARNA